MKIPAKLHPWLKLFRVPNLPTAPGDAIAGASLCLILLLADAGADTAAYSLAHIIGAGLASLFFYAAGLADNDITGVDDDIRNAPHRPIPSGEISIRDVQIARLACLLASVVIGLAVKMPHAWWLASFVLCAAIFAYNRYKHIHAFGLVAMGFCRGLSLMTGAAAVSAETPRAIFSTPVIFAALGWTAYISAVTWLAADEHVAEKPMRRTRYLPGLSVFIALAGIVSLVCDNPASYDTLIAPTLGCTAAFLIWLCAVAPLGKPHTPDIRRMAVGKTIQALPYLQLGFILALPQRDMALIALVLIVVGIAVRRTFADISGS